MTWTRAHDAWIAEHCEGQQSYTWDDIMPLYENTEPPSWPNREGCELQRKRYPDERFRLKHPSTEIPRYNLDHAACIRAAEAWASKAPDGTKRVIAIVLEYHAGEKMVVANLQQNDHHPYCGDEPGNSWVGNGKDISPSLAQALYRATGGPA